MKSLHSCIILASVLSALLTGCANVTPTRFYTLSPQPDDAATQQASATTATIGIGPIDFPRLLERPQLVTRTSPNEVHLAEFHQWGGSLKEEFARVLVDNLAARTRAPLHRHPWESRIRPDYQVLITLDRFDGTLGDTLVLRGQWQIVAVARREVLRTERILLETPLADTRYATYAAGMSRSVARLADQIAAGLAEHAGAVR
ncbi:MAG: membrane integrity-associated transporter subunit PqiC [Thiotrichales bacterium]